MIPEVIVDSTGKSICQEVGVVIPTQATRPEYLEETIRSLNVGDVRPFVALAGPDVLLLRGYLDSGMVDVLYTDLESIPLPKKIHECFERMPRAVEFITWIGDDDLLNLDSVVRAAEILKTHSDISLIYGQCRYIDSLGQLLFTNKPGRLAGKILYWGPQLISQPATLYKLADYLECGGLDESYTHAFDFDLFRKLERLGDSYYFSEVLASWRWHDGSLTVSRRWTSVREASKARKANTIKWRWLVEVLDWPVRIFTYLSGKLLGLVLKLRTR